MIDRIILKITNAIDHYEKMIQLTKSKDNFDIVELEFYKDKQQGLYLALEIIEEEIKYANNNR